MIKPGPKTTEGMGALGLILGTFFGPEAMGLDFIEMLPQNPELGAKLNVIRFGLQLFFATTVLGVYTWARVRVKVSAPEVDMEALAQGMKEFYDIRRKV